MIINQRDDRHRAVTDSCRAILTAIRTAPKARGVDLIEAAIVEGDDLIKLSEAMKSLHAETGRPVYDRDSANILQGDAVIIIGTHSQDHGTQLRPLRMAPLRREARERPLRVQ